MNQIRDWLYIGKYADTANLKWLQQTKIDAVLQLAQAVNYRGIESTYVAMEDGESFTREQLQTALDFIREQHDKDHTLIVACGAGISRSTTVVMAALMEYEGLDLFDAYAEVLSKHPAAEPHYALIISLAEYHGIELTPLDVIRGLREAQKKIKP